MWNFFVTSAATAKRAVLGIDACREIELVYIDDGNICEDPDGLPSTSSTAAGLPTSTVRKRGRGRGVRQQRTTPPPSPPADAVAALATNNWSPVVTDQSPANAEIDATSIAADKRRHNT